MRKHYATIITTLTFLIVAGLAVWFFANISWGPGSDIISLTIDLKELAAVEEVTATAVGDETATAHLSPGIWSAELEINREDYDGVRVESVDGFGNMWWSGHRHAFVVGTQHPRSVDAGAVHVTTRALPGYEWTVTFTRHEAR